MIKKLAMAVIVLGVLIPVMGCSERTTAGRTSQMQERNMKVEKLVVGALGTNCYIVVADHAREALVIDPGGSAGLIYDTIAAEDLDVKYIILTHGHWDHFSAALEVARKTGAKVGVHTLDEEALKRPDISLASWLGDTQEVFTPDFTLTDGQVIKLGDLECKVIHTPGHSAGSITIQIADSLFVGDLIFQGSIGRTDFAGGSHETLLKSVRERIFIFPDQVRIYPGHGPATTVGEEKRENPFFNGEL